MSQPPSLTKLFAVIGGAIFLLAATALGYMNWTRSVSQLTSLGEDYNVTLAAALLNATRGELQPLLRAAVTMDGESVRRDPRPVAMREAVLGLTQDTRVAKVKIYSASGLTVFSSDPSQIGVEKGLYPRLRAALAGRTVSEIEYGEGFVDFGGRRAVADLLSSYLPVRAADGRVIGVFEVYTDVTGLNAAIVRTEAFNFAILLLSFGAIYGLLLTTVAAGSRAIAREHQENLELAAAMARAQAADRAKSDFLANMSHELRTPLNAIIGFAQVLRDEMFGALGSRYRDYAADINDSGQHLLGLINDILDLSKIESGKTELHEDDIEIAPLLRSALNMVHERAISGGVTLETDIPDGLPALHADERKLKQILVNLLSNAVKFTRAGGVVTLRTWCTANSGYLFQVQDTGIGMAQAEISKALAPFGQVDSALNRQYEGTGLGLPLSKALTELHGGTLDLQSEPGVGTTVTLRLPAARLRLGPADRLSAATAEQARAS